MSDLLRDNVYDEIAERAIAGVPYRVWILVTPKMRVKVQNRMAAHFAEVHNLEALFADRQVVVGNTLVQFISPNVNCCRGSSWDYFLIEEETQKYMEETMSKAEIASLHDAIFASRNPI